jgi:hypothetical protein
MISFFPTGQNTQTSYKLFLKSLMNRMEAKDQRQRTEIGDTLQTRRQLINRELEERQRIYHGRKTKFNNADDGDVLDNDVDWLRDFDIKAHAGKQKLNREVAEFFRTEKALEPVKTNADLDADLQEYTRAQRAETLEQIKQL